MATSPKSLANQLAGLSSAARRDQREVVRHFAAALERLLEDRSGRDVPFAFLNDVSERQLRQALGDECLQTVALVVSYLPKQVALRYLSGLDATEQDDLIRRLAVLRPVEATIAREVSSILRDRLSRSAASAGGPTRVAA
jgi:flagellar motor switch protein FliG